MTQKTRNIIGWALTIILTLVFIFSAVMKLAAHADTLQAAAYWGISPHKLKLIALTEIISTLLFVIPRTGLLGTLLMAAYLGGVIATHLEHYMPVLLPVILQCAIWITALIRFPELSKRLVGETPGG